MADKAYWAEFESFAREENLDLRLRHGYFMINPIPFVPVTTHAHFAVVASRGSKVRSAGNRVQLVLEGKHADHYFAALSRHRSRIDAEILGAEWLDQPAGKACHIEVRKEHNLDSPAAWPEDFEWLLRNLLLFRRVLAPCVQAARLSL